MASPPKQRMERLIVQSLGDDVLVYDAARDMAHSLTGIAAAVFLACDGERSLDDIAGAASDRLGEPVAVELVVQTLAEIDEIHLLEGEQEYSRRQVMRRAGLVGGAVTIGAAAISTIAVPTPAHAQTGPQGPPGPQGPQGPPGPQGPLGQ